MFSIGQVVSWFLTGPDGKRSTKDNVGFGFGCVCLFFLRPHIAAAWLGGMAIGNVQPTQSLVKSFAMGLAFVVIAIGAVYGVDMVKPGFLQSLNEEGLMQTMDQKYQSRKHIGDTAIYGQNDPIPVATGLGIIGLTPPPGFWGSPPWLVLGMESLATTLALLCSWMFMAVSRAKLLSRSSVTGAGYVILLLAFYLSYSYNMGLAVRMKMQVVPAMIILISGPVFQRQLSRLSAQQQEFAVQNQSAPFAIPQTVATR